MDIKEVSIYLESVDPGSYTEEAFNAAAAQVSKSEGLDQEAKLQLYGLYKQCLKGDVDSSRPWFDMVGQAKWDAWNEFKGMPQVNAGLAYIFIVENFLPNREKTSDGSVNTGDVGSIFTSMGVVSSSIKTPLGDETPWSDAESIFDAISNDDSSKVQGCLAQGADVNMVDADGMSALHYAVDRAHHEIVQLLIDAGANVNAKDGDGQTPLMYAVTCEHEDLVSVLLQAGADASLADEDGLSVCQFHGLSETMRQLLPA